MEFRSEKDLAGIVGSDRTLSALLRAGKMFDELDRHLQPVLSDTLRGHAQVACVDGECLVLAADSPAWASRARLEAPALLEAARKIWPRELNNWRVIVRRGP
jgi:hypothetical protein